MTENAAGESGEMPLPFALADRMAALRAAVQGVAEVDPLDLDVVGAAEVLRELGALAGRLEAVAATVLPVVEADGRWALEGWRSFASWLAMTERISLGAARKQIRLARALRDELPGTARAAVRGEITLEHAQVLTTLGATSARRREVLAAPDAMGQAGDESGAGAGPAAEERVCNESFLLEQARGLAVDQFRTLVRRWAAAADPDADARGFTGAQEREFFELSHTLDGYHVAGFLTVAHALGLQCALDAVIGVPAVGESRTRAQRRAQGLADLGRLVLDHGLAGAGGAVRPHLSVVVEHDTLVRILTDRPAANAGDDAGRAYPTVPAGAVGVDATTFRLAEFTDGQPIPRAVLATLACDSAVNRVIFGPPSAVVDVGRTERTFTGMKRRAVIARDRHCRYPGCDAPPALGEIHHVEHWGRDHGRTSVATGILLCWHHHQAVHSRGIEIHRGAAGHWAFTHRDGTELRPPLGKG